jgi:hypothetical protein
MNRIYMDMDTELDMDMVEKIMMCFDWNGNELI